MNKYMKKTLVISVLVLLLLGLTVPMAFAAGGTYHKVYYGETLFSIGRQYQVNPYRIANVNNLRNPNHIYAGQVLYIPEGGYNDGCGWGNCDDHNMDHGNGCGWGNCDDHNMDHGNGCGWNNCDDYQVDYDYGCSRGCNGQNDGYNNDYQMDYRHDSNYHRVERGETLSRIAYYYGVSPWAIARVNNIYNLNRIYVGQVLRIPSGYNSY